MAAKRIGLAGTGNRGRFLIKLLLAQRPDWRCGILIDPHPPSLQRALSELGDPSIPTATEFAAAASAPAIDGWIMAAHERAHLDAARHLFPLGAPVYFEKPVARTVAEGRELLRLQRRHDALVLVGYELRWAPFYARARAIIRSGRLGKVTSIAADERLDGGFYVAGWRRGPWRSTVEAGSLLLTKCSHDLDYITWLLDALPLSVASVGGRRAFLPEPRATLTCLPCPLRPTCPYSPENWSYASAWRGGPDTRPDLECAFNCPGDVVDHQLVQFQFPDDVHASFSVSAPAPRTERRITVAGTDAWIEGNMEDGELHIVPCHGGKPEHLDLRGVKGDAHGGGDRRIMADYIRWLEEPGFVPETTLLDGYRSLAIGCAADDARLTGRPVALAEYLREDRHESSAIPSP